MSTTTPDTDDTAERFDECPKCGGHVQQFHETHIAVTITYSRCTECSWRTSKQSSW